MNVIFLVQRITTFKRLNKLTDRKGCCFMSECKTELYPYRPPKKYFEKSLHGRVRGVMIPYEKYERAVMFYNKVFGWDMMRVPQGVFIEDSDDRPHLKML